MPLRDLAMALAAVTAFGLSFVAIKVGVAHVPPLTLTALRFLFAALPAVLLVPRPQAPARLVAMFGLAIGVGLFGSMFVAIKLGMPAGLAAVVVQVQVFLTIALAWMLDGQRPARVQVWGAAVAAVGMVLVGAARVEGAALLPLLIVLMAAVFWAAANMVGKRAGNADRLALVVWGSLAAPLPLLVLSLVLEGPQAIAASLSPPTWQAVASVLFMAYPATVMAFSFWSVLLQRHPAALVAPFGLLIPVVGMAASYVAFGETLSPLEATGSALILVGLLVGLTAHTGGAGRGGVSRV